MPTQRYWRWCRKCAVLFSSSDPGHGVCPADNASHDDSNSAPYLAVIGEEATGQQGGWRWCGKCQQMFYGGGQTQGVCPADHQAHDGSRSAHYATKLGEDSPGQQGGWRWCQDCQTLFNGDSVNQGTCAASNGQQSGWRWCRKCQGMFSSDNPSHGQCPASGPHDGGTSSHYSVLKGESGSNQQGGWRWCRKCQGLFYAGGDGQGVCPSDKKSHDGASSLHYAVVEGNGTQGQQPGWRWCQKCQGLFSSDDPSHGICPAGAAHDGSTSLSYVAFVVDARGSHDGSTSAHYAMSIDPVPADTETFDAKNLPSDLPLGGSAHLTVRKNGDYVFSCYAHDSGFDNITYGITAILVTASGLVFTMQHTGSVEGTVAGLPFGTPRRDDTFVQAPVGNNPQIQSDWANIAGAKFTAQLIGTDVTADGIEKALQALLVAAGTAAGTALIALL